MCFPQSAICCLRCSSITPKGISVFQRISTELLFLIRRHLLKYSVSTPVLPPTKGLNRFTHATSPSPVCKVYFQYQKRHSSFSFNAKEGARAKKRQRRIEQLKAIRQEMADVMTLAMWKQRRRILEKNFWLDRKIDIHHDRTLLWGKVSGLTICRKCHCN